METVNDVLYFSSKLVLVGYLESSDYDKFNWITKILKDEFQDIGSDKLVKMLGVVDNLHIIFLTQEF